MPGWLAATTKYNLLTYAVDAIQSLMTPSFRTSIGVTPEIGVLIITAFDVIMLLVSTYLFRRKTRRLIA
jgi:ABC-type multidrug transport system permease subunit